MIKNLLFLVALTAASLPLHAQVIGIDNAELERLMQSGVPVIDIRRSDEWRETGVVSNSHLLTFFDAQGRYDTKSWLSKATAIAGRNEPVILLCRSGGRSGVLSKFLHAELGYTKIYDVSQGIVEWMAAGRPTVPPTP